MNPRREIWQRAAVVTAGTAAVVVLALTMATVALVHRIEPPPVPQPMTIEAGLVNLPPQTVPTPPEPRRAEPPPPPEPPPPSPSSEPLRRIAPVPKPKESRPRPSAHVPEKTDNPPSQTTTPAPPEKASPPSAEAPRNQEPSRGTGAARAILQPSPVVPPELRHRVLALEAVVRFTIATDGTATAELEEATPDPRINQILLDAFRHWRFFPAMQEGKPIASTLVLRVPIRVE